MTRVGEEEEPPFDFWAIRRDHTFRRFPWIRLLRGQSDWVWRSADSRFEYIMINSRENRDVFMVIVVNRLENSVAGHRLLDLPSQYGIGT